MNIQISPALSTTPVHLEEQLGSSHFEMDRVVGNIGKIQPYMFEPDHSFEEEDEEDVGSFPGGGWHLY